MGQIRFTSSALKDLNLIRDYIAKDAESYADKFIDKIINRIKVLENYPMAGKVVAEFENPFIRELLEGYYRIIYEVQSGDVVSVLRVYHGARLLKEL